MKKLFLLIAFAGVALANQAVEGFCEQGNIAVQTSGLPSTNVVQGSFPSCTVSVFTAGTTNLITIFSDNLNTPLSNPFTANASGRWIFYTANNQRVDIQLSGGGLPSSWSIKDIIVNDLSAGGIIAPSNISGIRIVDGSRFTQNAAGINAADADLGATMGEVWIPSGVVTATDTQISIRAGHTLRIFGQVTIDALNRGPVLLGGNARVVCSGNFGAANLLNVSAQAIPSMIRLTTQDGSLGAMEVDGCRIDGNGSTVTNGVIDASGAVNGPSWIKDNFITGFASNWGIFIQDIQSGALAGTNNVQMTNNRISATGTGGCIEILHSSTNSVALQQFAIQDTNCVPGSTATSGVLLQNPVASSAENLRGVTITNLTINPVPAGQVGLNINGTRVLSLRQMVCTNGTTCINLANNTNNSQISLDNIESNGSTNSIVDVGNSTTLTNAFVGHFELPASTTTTTFRSPVTAGNINNIRIVDGVKFAQTAAGINAADADLGNATPGEIWVPSGNITATDAQISIGTRHVLRIFGKLTIEASASKGPILLGDGAGIICSFNAGASILEATGAATIASMVRLTTQDGSQVTNYVQSCDFFGNAASVTNGIIDASGITQLGWIRDNRIHNFNSGFGIFIQDIQSGALGGTNSVQILNNQITASNTGGCIEILHSATNSVSLSGFSIIDNFCSPGASATNGVLLQNPAASISSHLLQVSIQNLLVTGMPAAQNAVTINGIQFGSFKAINCQAGSPTNCVNVSSNANNLGLTFDNIECNACTNILNDVANSTTVNNNFLSHYDFVAISTSYSGTYFGAVNNLKVNGTATAARINAVRTASVGNNFDVTGACAGEMGCIINNAIKDIADTTPEGIVINAFGGGTISTNPFATIGNRSVKVYFGAGVWTVNVSIPIPKATQIEGMGRGAVADGKNTIMKAGGSFPASTAMFAMGINPVDNGVQIRNLGIDCQNVSGAIGIQNQFSQEQSLVDHVLIANCPGNALTVSGSAQNSGPYTDLEILNPTCSNCAAGTVPISIGAVSFFRGIKGATINSNGSTLPTVALRIDASGTYSDIHIESAVSSIVVGSQNGTGGVIISNVGCGPSITDCVKISNAFSTQNIDLLEIGSTTGNIITDQILGNTLTQAAEGGTVAAYIIGNGSPQTLFTSSASFPKIAHQIVSGTVTLTTAAITSLNCGTVATGTATGAVAGDVIEWSFAGSPGGGVLQLLTLSQWVTSNTVNFQYCNPTAGSLTPGAATANFRIIRP